MTQRLSGLEAVRGIAALMVLWTHAGMFAGYATAAAALFAYGHLAVDLFFLLSGFVLARTYEHRMPGTAQFVSQRFVRLWAPVATGVLAGGLYYAVTGMAGDALVLNLLAGLAILPVLGGSVLFNPPAWSIFFELFANAAHALTLRGLSNKSLALVVAASAAVLLIGMGEDGLDAGFGETLWLGFPRVVMSYALGVLLWRINGDTVRVDGRAGWPVLALYAFTVAIFPAILQGAGEVAFALLINPVVLIASLDMRSGRVVTALGAFSFPLYALHYPVLTWLMALGAQWWGAMGLALVVCCALGLVVDRRLRAALLPARMERQRATA